ncbi:hypothetical protein [Rhodococcus sp. B10]|uniref:hypothetical protein n=1 Tax=Rhodococcus sp. B10 TaxID=2695876 RepID=UPI0014309632|nr:hypothetical protein [Rhodococcus sp. B10]NIL76788.1 hypothetical protein [Rhodococcus sp. B10]
MTVHVVIGPPCAGKSTFVQESARPGDLIIDFDALASAFGSVTAHDTPLAMRRVVQSARRAAITQVLMGTVEHAWIIDTDPDRSMLAQYSRAGAELHVVDPGQNECLLRADRDKRPPWTADQIRRWYRRNPSKRTA